MTRLAGWARGWRRYLVLVPSATACALLALAGVLNGQAGVLGAPAPGATGEVARPFCRLAAAQDEASAWLPVALTGRRGIEPPNPATRESQGMTATAAAAGTATALAPHLTRTLEASPTTGGQATPHGTWTPGPPPTAAASETSSPTPTDTPAPTATSDDPSAQRLSPLGASRPGPVRVSYAADRRVVRLANLADPPIVYELDLTHPDVERGRLSVRETTSGRYPISGAGFYYRRLDGRLVEPWLTGRLGQVESLDHVMLPDGVQLTVRETLEERPHERRFTVRIVGRSLEVRAESLGGVAAAAGAYAGFSAGDVVGSADGLSLRLPFMDAVPVTMLDRRWFVSSLVDYPRSSGTALSPRGPEALANGFVNEVSVLYLPDGAGNVRPVDETVWVTLSPDVADVFAVPSTSASRHRAWLSDKVHLTLAGRAPAATFASEAHYVARLQALGVTELVVHKEHWSDGASGAPAPGQPDPAAGGVPGWQQLLAATSGRLAPAQAYTTTVTGCPGRENPLYRPEDRVFDALGEPKRLTDEAGGRVPCPAGGFTWRYLLPPGAASRVAVTEGAARAVGASAVHLLDVVAGNPAYPLPGAVENVLDLAAPPRHEATVGEAIRAYHGLFSALQSDVGPLYGDGAASWSAAGYASFFAGAVDGLARSGSAREPPEAHGGRLVVPDYELAVIRPRAIGYGLGRLAARLGPEGEPQAVPLPDEVIDRWRATALAFGHAGAWTSGDAPGGGDWLTAAEQVKEYHLMRPLQRRYLASATAAVTYVTDDGQGDLSWALVAGLDLMAPRLLLTYDGMRVWVNMGLVPWRLEVDGAQHTLPPHGWLAVGDDGLLAFSATVEGRRVDLVDAPEAALIDGRGTPYTAAGLSGRDLVVRLPDGRRVEELPGGELRVTP